MVSAMGVGHPEAWSEEMTPYYQAKADADRELEASGLEYTIVRPGRLSDDPGTGLVETALQLDHSGEIPREDVATTLLAVLDTPSTIDKGFDLIGGETPIARAVQAL
jgi:uncharacterized protein YbjT (DUF2867 family)